MRGGPALPPGGAFSFRSASRGAGTTSQPTPTPAREGPARLPESPAPESQSPRAATKFLHQAAPSPSPRGLSLFPISSPRPAKVWPQPARAQRPHSPCGKRSLGARRAREQGVAARARSSSQRPSRPGCRLNREGEEAAGVTCPLSHPLRDARSAAPARLPGTREGRGAEPRPPGGSGREGRAPGWPRPARTARPAPLDHAQSLARDWAPRLLWGIGSGRWTHYISFLAQMPSPEVIWRLHRNNVKIVLRHDSGMTLGKSERRKTWPRVRLAGGEGEIRTSLLQERI